MADNIQRVLVLMECLSSYSDEEEEIDLVIQYWRHDVPRIHDYRQDVVDSYTDDQFRKTFRMLSGTCDLIVSMFEESDFYPSAHIRGKELKSARTHILAFLWYVGNKSVLRSVSERFDTSISCLHAMNDRVIEFLLDVAPHVISFPTTDPERQRIADEFEQISGFPGVVGCVDGSYINVRCPSHKIKSTYINRHDQTSLTFQGICEANKRFLDCFTGVSSKIHDSRIFQMSFIYPIINGMGQHFHVLGDAAYGISTNVLTPFRDYGNQTEVQRHYNYKFSQTRVKIENTFGLLKARFRQLIRIDLNTVVKQFEIILCCCVLHNFCIDNNDYLPEPVNVFNYHIDQPHLNIHGVNRDGGIQKRDYIAGIL